MKTKLASVFLLTNLVIGAGVAHADRYQDVTDLFMHSGQSASYFSNSYGYAVFPTVGKGGLGVGAAHGTGRVYEQGRYIGDTAMTQVSFGLQAGGQAYSEIVFFQDERALKEFTSGHFEFGAGVNAVAITAAAGASTGTRGSQASANAGKNATNAGGYYKGVAVFTVVKGGAMYEASISGQKFSYTPADKSVATK